MIKQTFLLCIAGEPFEFVDQVNGWYEHYFYENAFYEIPFNCVGYECVCTTVFFNDPTFLNAHDS